MGIFDEMFAPAAAAASAQSQQPAPLASPGVSQPFISPFASYRPDTALSQPTAQDQLAAAWTRELGKIAQGPSRADKWDDGITSIFTRVVAPAVAAFGGDGTSQGANQFVQGMRQEVLDAKTERRQSQQDALSTVKGLTDIINNTSPGGLKSLSASAKIAQGQQKLAQDATKMDNNKQYREQKLAAQELRDKTMSTTRDMANKLGWARLGFDQKKFDEQEARIKDIEGKKLVLEKRAQDIQASGKSADRQIELAKLQSGIQQFNTKLSAETQQFNEKLKLNASAVKTDPATGQVMFVHQDANGKQYEVPSIPDTGVDFQFAGIDKFSDDPAVAKILSEIDSSAQPATAQPATAAKAPPPAAVAKFMARIQSMNPQQIESERQMFLKTLGSDPFAMLQGASNGR